MEHGAHARGRSQGTFLGEMHREILEGDFGQSKPLALAFRWANAFVWEGQGWQQLPPLAPCCLARSIIRTRCGVGGEQPAGGAVPPLLPLQTT